MAFSIPVCADAELALDPLRLKPNHVIKLEVFGEPDLATQTEIRETGEAVFPLIGAVKIVDLTLEEATKRIRGLYEADHLADPKLTLTVMGLAVDAVSVLGAVNAPGRVPIPADGQLDLLTAIVCTGGFTELANRKKVTVTRGGNPMLINTREGNEQKARQFKLRPGDIVTVAERIF